MRRQNLPPIPPPETESPEGTVNVTAELAKLDADISPLAVLVRHLVDENKRLSERINSIENGIKLRARYGG